MSTPPRHPRALVGGGAILAVLFALAALAPWLAPYDPRALSGGALEGPSAQHLFGTNDIGQDIVSQLLWGARVSLGVALPAAALAMALAIVVGMGAGLRGGWTDMVAMRVVDASLALPGMPLIILLAALASPGPVGIAVIVGVVGWPPAARILRSQVLSLRRRGFVMAAQGFGAPGRYVVSRHVAPAVAPVLAAGFVQWAAAAVLLEAGLAFLGLGDPTGISWGRMLDRAIANQSLFADWQWTWLVIPPGVGVSLAVLGFALVGLGLEPRFNPRWRRMA